MTAQPLYDGTFSTEAVAAAGHALLDQLHQEALATIASLAENWDQPDQPEQPPLVEEAEATTWSDPETWSADDEDDDEGAVRLLQRFELPALPPRPRPAVAKLVLVEPQPAEPVVAAEDVTSAATDQFTAPSTADREYIAV